MAMMVGSIILLSSCGGSGVSADAKKMADLNCKKYAATLKSKQNPEDTSLDAEVEKINKELEEFTKSMRKKYEGKDDANKKAKEIYKKEIDACQAKKDLDAFREEESKKAEIEAAAARATMDSLTTAAAAAIENLKK